MLTVKVLEVGELDALAHAEHVGGGAEAVDHHPEVARVQGCDLVGSLASKGIARVSGESVGDVGPCGNNGAEDHETEAEQGHAGDGAAEPEHLAVGDEDDCHVLEDGVNGNAKVLKRLAAGVDHANEQQGDGEPLARLVGVEVAEFGKAHDLEDLDYADADNALFILC